MTLLRKAHKGLEIVRYAMVRGAASVFGFKPRHRALDRVFFDERILPALARDKAHARVLFVGCDWYTTHVADLFADAEYTTLEIDPSRTRFGASRHIVDALSNLGAHVAPNSLDLIIANGVIGWGLNDPTEIARSLAACAAALCPGGTLVLGWDDVPEKRPVDVEQVVAGHGFAPHAPSSIEAPRIALDTYAKHTFGFWSKL